MTDWDVKLFVIIILEHPNSVKSVNPVYKSHVIVQSLIVQTVQNKNHVIAQSVQNKSHVIAQSVQNKSHVIVQSVQYKIHVIAQSVQNKIHVIAQSYQNHAIIQHKTLKSGTLKIKHKPSQMRKHN